MVQTSKSHWMAGHVRAHWYRESSWPEGDRSAYLVQLLTEQADADTDTDADAQQPPAAFVHAPDDGTLVRKRTVLPPSAPEEEEPGRLSRGVRLALVLQIVLALYYLVGAIGQIW